MIKITVPSIMTQEGHFVLGQEVSCSAALEAHLVDIAAGRRMNQKIVQPTYEKKSEVRSSQSSQPDKASQKKMPKKRATRRKSSQSTTPGE